MRGYLLPEEKPQANSTLLHPWEVQFIDAIGNVIDFWGFKRNQGRVWGLLYLREKALSAAEIQKILDLSKGGVSMITRELEQWGVIHRVRSPGSSCWHFVAETDIMSMIDRVFKERESGILARIQEDLNEAEKCARENPETPKEVLEKIVKIRKFACIMENIISLILNSASLGNIKNLLSNLPPEKSPK